jgi:hypothetical protein
MQPDETDLARLLWPIEPAAFFRDFWEKQPLAVTRNDPGYYGDLFALGDVDSVIAYTRPRFAGFAGPPSGSFVQGRLPDEAVDAAAEYPDAAAVHRAFARGRTVIISAMQLRWQPVAELSRRLELFFGCPVHTNLYLTPPGAQGFDAHFDTHEVFVLQIAGGKHWRFYGPARELPLAEEWAPLDRGSLGPPTQEAIVRPGDLLYMPRGHIHEAFTSDSVSLHLTVGVKVFRWADLLREALDAVSGRDARFRGSLPPGLLTGGAAPPAGRVRELLTALAEGADSGEALDRLAAGFFGKLPTLPGGLFAADPAEAVGLDTVLERPAGATGRVVRLGDGRVALCFPGGRLDGPAKTASALEFVTRTLCFAVRDLPDDLTADGKLTLARRLVRERVVAVVPPAGEP